MHDPLFWTLAVVGIFLTAVSKSGFAGGTGTIAVPLMALVIEPRHAAALILPLLVFIDAFNLKTFWGQGHPVLLKKLLLGGLLGTALGVLCFEYLSANMVKGMLGALSLWFGIRNLTGMKPVTQSDHMASLAGTIGGFTSFIAHAGGPPVNGYLLGKKLDKNTFIATVCLFLGIGNMIKLPVYAMTGQFSADVGPFLLLIPVAFIGIRTGYWLKDRIPADTYARLMNVFLLLTGVLLLLEVGYGAWLR